MQRERETSKLKEYSISFLMIPRLIDSTLVVF